MNKQQKIALQHYCRLDVETLYPRFRIMQSKYSIILTVNAGFE